MSKRGVLVLEREESPWCHFLAEFLEETSSEISLVSEAKRAADYFDRTQVDVAFVNTSLLSLPLTEKIGAYRQRRPGFSLFGIGKRAAPAASLRLDAAWEAPESAAQIQRELVRHLDLPNPIRVLVIDDEREIAEMIRDYLEGASTPSFKVLHAENGAEGLAAVRRENPDVVVLDIKMPVLRGDEFYRQLRAEGRKTPVIVFFDALSEEELASIRAVGKAAVVEKGGRESAMPAMMGLIKKMAYFG